MSGRTRSALAAVVAALSLAVAVAPASAGTLDQQHTGDPLTGVGIVGPDSVFSGPASLAQTFTAGLSGALDQVDIPLSRLDADGPVTVELRDVSGGAPGATVLASTSVAAAAVPAAVPSGEVFDVAVPFAAPAPVLAGSQYAIVAYTGGDDMYRSQAVGDGSDGYTGGGLFITFTSPPASWSTGFSLDLRFKTYVIPSAQPPAALINGLINSVGALNLPKGTENGLQSKLTGAQKNLATGDIGGACSKLTSFIAQVTALRDKKIVPASAANALITDAQTVRNSLHCA